MKKHVWMAAVLIGVLALTGCGSKKQADKAGDAAVEAETDAKTKSEDASEALSEAAEEALSEEAGEAAEDAIVEELGARPEYDAKDFVTLGTYEGLTVTVDDIEVTDAQIDQRIEDKIRDGGFMEVVTEGKVQNGDIANIDYVGKKDDVAFDGGSAEGYDLTIGSGTFIPGFEEGLMDAAIGESVDLNLTFPEEYHSEELAGADVAGAVKSMQNYYGFTTEPKNDR